MRAVPYVRVSTVGQGEGLSRQSQRDRIGAYCAEREWQELEHVTDVGSGKRINRNLAALLRKMDRQEADVLVVARLDRLSRSAYGFHMMLDRADKGGWSIVCLDPLVDMTTPFGRMVAGVAAVFAQWERELISQRQRESVQARRAAGTYRLGGQAVEKLTDEAKARIRAMEGQNSKEVAMRLAFEGIVEVDSSTIRKFRIRERST